MSSEWEQVNLTDVCSDVSYGYTESATNQPVGPKFLRITDIQGGSFDWDTVPFCTATEDCVRKYQLEVGDIVVARTGNSTGENAQVVQEPPAAVFASYLIRFRPNSERVNPFFVGYLLRSERFKQHVLAVRGGSAQPGANAKQLGSFVFHLIPRHLQNYAVESLRAIDDRIALLRETNATLEAIAQALFKSWFVDFDPVHAKARGESPQGMDDATAALFPDSFEESELGMVPKGWKVGVLGEVADTVRKQIQPGAMTADTLYVGLEHIPRLSLGLNAWGTAEELESAKSCFEKGDVLFGKLRPYFHKIVIAPFEGVCSTDILVCRAKSPEYYAFVLMHLFSTELVSYADRLSNGAKMPRVNWNDLAAYQVAIPPTELALTYMDVVKPMFAQITDNVLQAQTLAILRDALLPRLISGQLRLPETEAALQEAGL